MSERSPSERVLGERALSERALRERSARRGSVRAIVTTVATVATVTLVAIVAVTALTVRRDRDVAQRPPAAPDFAMVAYQGEAVLGSDDVRLSDLIGKGTPTVVNFWASACPPCREEMPGFQRVYEELGTRFTLVGVDVGPFVGLGTHAGAKTFLADYDIAYPAAYAVDDASVRAYDIFSMPMTLFFDGAGRIVNRHTGYLSEPRFRDAIAGLIASAE